MSALKGIVAGLLINFMLINFHATYTLYKKCGFSMSCIGATGSNDDNNNIITIDKENIDIDEIESQCDVQKQCQDEIQQLANEIISKEKESFKIGSSRTTNHNTELDQISNLEQEFLSIQEKSFELYNDLISTNYPGADEEESLEPSTINLQKLLSLKSFHDVSFVELQDLIQDSRTELSNMVLHPKLPPATDQELQFTCSNEPLSTSNDSLNQEKLIPLNHHLHTLIYNVLQELQQRIEFYQQNEDVAVPLTRYSTKILSQELLLHHDSTSEAVEGECYKLDQIKHLFKIALEAKERQLNDIWNPNFLQNVTLDKTQMRSIPLAKILQHFIDSPLTNEILSLFDSVGEAMGGYYPWLDSIIDAFDSEEHHVSNFLQRFVSDHRLKLPQEFQQQSVLLDELLYSFSNSLIRLSR